MGDAISTESSFLARIERRADRGLALSSAERSDENRLPSTPRHRRVTSCASEQGFSARPREDHGATWHFTLALSTAHDFKSKFS
jgi:hypothetical protein